MIKFQFSPDVLFLNIGKQFHFHQSAESIHLQDVYLVQYLNSLAEVFLFQPFKVLDYITLFCLSKLYSNSDNLFGRQGQMQKFKKKLVMLNVI